MHSSPSLPVQSAPPQGVTTRPYAGTSMARSNVKIPEPPYNNNHLPHTHARVPDIPIEVQRELGSEYPQSSPTYPTTSYPVNAHAVPLNSGLGNSGIHTRAPAPYGPQGTPIDVPMGTPTAVPSSAVPHSTVSLPASAASPLTGHSNSSTSAVPSSVVASALGSRRAPGGTPGGTPNGTPNGTPTSTPTTTPSKSSSTSQQSGSRFQHTPGNGSPMRNYNVPASASLGASQNLASKASSKNPNIPGLRSQRRSSSENSLTVDQFEVIRAHSATQSHNPRAQLQLARTLCEAADHLAHRYVDPTHPSSKDVDSAQQSANRTAWVSQSLSITRQLSHKLDFADAQYFMGTILTNGTYNLDADPRRALEYYLKAARQDHSEACYRVAVCKELGVGTDIDIEDAIHFYKRAAQLGSPAAMYKLGMIALSSSPATRYLNMSTTDSHANDSSATLNDVNENNIEVRNFAIGFEWLELAAARADSRNPHSLYELGLLYEHASIGCYQKGDPLPLNESKSIELHSAAASLGYAPAQSRVGRALEFGELGCQIDPVLSLEYYYAAATQGDADAELAMAGWCWTGGPTLPRSETDALHWAERAAEKKNSRALYCLGYFCECGVGRPADKERAFSCYEAAAIRGHARAIEKVAARQEKQLPLPVPKVGSN